MSSATIPSVIGFGSYRCRPLDVCRGARHPPSVSAASPPTPRRACFISRWAHAATCRQKHRSWAIRSLADAVTHSDRQPARYHEGRCRGGGWTRGYRAVVLDAPLVGDAREAARRHVADVADLSGRAGRPLCVISSGETTVRVQGSGLGGRNQELLGGQPAPLSPLGTLVAAASVGTDGVDGPTHAAGAFADSQTIPTGPACWSPPHARCSSRQQSYAFLTRSAISSTWVRPAQTSATFRYFS